MDKDRLEDAITCVIRGTDKAKQYSLNQIIEYIVGWPPTGDIWEILGYGIERVSKIMKKKPRRTGENYAQHSIAAAKEVCKSIDLDIFDLTMAFGALNHDNIEELKDYEDLLKGFQYAKTDSEKKRIIDKAEKIRKKCLEDSLSFFNKMESKKLASCNIDVKSAVGLEDGLTKRPDEFYHEYLERISGRNKLSIPKHDPLLNILRMLIIKTAGDRLHNNSTVPRESYPREKNRFTIPQRLKECYKSMMMVNRDVNFMKDYPEANEHYPAYFKFLKYSKSSLIKVASSLVSDDMHYLTPSISSDVALKIKDLFRKYNDYTIKEPATENELMNNPKRIFDGTLARYDTWLRKKYIFGITKPEDIRLNNANKMWMKKQLSITDPLTRLFVQEYLDSLVFQGVFNKFLEDEDYTLKGFKKIND